MLCRKADKGRDGVGVAMADDGVGDIAVGLDGGALFHGGDEQHLQLQAAEQLHHGADAVAGHLAEGFVQQHQTDAVFALLVNLQKAGADGHIEGCLILAAGGIAADAGQIRLLPGDLIGHLNIVVQIGAIVHIVRKGGTGGVTLSDYVDYRTYLDYDIKVTNRVTGQQAYLSRVSRDSSGGENQAPFYVAICASLLQIYEKSENSIRLVLLDEAFSKMTSDRIRPMMELFRRLQLQVLLISTVEKSTAIQPYCDITYSIVRHGDTNAIAPFVRLAAE